MIFMQCKVFLSNFINYVHPHIKKGYIKVVCKNSGTQGTCLLVKLSKHVCLCVCSNTGPNQTWTCKQRTDLSQTIRDVASSCSNHSRLTLGHQFNVTVQQHDTSFMNGASNITIESLNETMSFIQIHIKGSCISLNLSSFFFLCLHVFLSYVNRERLTETLNLNTF